MNRVRCAMIVFAALGSLAFHHSGTAPAEDFTKYVNNFVGTGGHGHTHPAAAVPFGMVQIGPDTFNEGWDWCSGYHYSDSSIMGFSHTHLSGTGVGDMLDVLVMPMTGELRTEPGTRDQPGSGCRSRFSHSKESATPGYYSVVLDDYGIRAELTATERAGFHRYTFPKSEQSHTLIDLNHRYMSGSSKVLEAVLNIEGETLITGFRRVQCWAPNRHVYFAMRFSKPFAAAGTVSDGRRDASSRQARGTDLKASVDYHAVDVIAEAWLKGFKGFDIEKAFRLMRVLAMMDDYHGLERYKKLGYVPADREAESASKTLEYSCDDWAITQVAKALGKTDDYKLFKGRAASYRNLFDRSTGFIRPKLASGD
jgi:putative alpha-1,2-mannosidase